MKKFIKNNLFGFILGLLVASVTTVLALDPILSKQVTFSPENPDEWEARDVETALNDLYGFASTKKTMQLVASNVRIYNGQYEIDCTHIPNYQLLTTNDFYYVLSGFSDQPSGTTNSQQTLSIYKSYNPSTGKLTYGRSSCNSCTPYIYVDIYVIK